MRHVRTPGVTKALRWWWCSASSESTQTDIINVRQNITACARTCRCSPRRRTRQQGKRGWQLQRRLLGPLMPFRSGGNRRPERRLLPLLHRTIPRQGQPRRTVRGKARRREYVRGAGRKSWDGLKAEAHRRTSPTRTPPHPPCINCERLGPGTAQQQAQAKAGRRTQDECRQLHMAPKQCLVAPQSPAPPFPHRCRCRATQAAIRLLACCQLELTPEPGSGGWWSLGRGAVPHSAPSIQRHEPTTALPVRVDENPRAPSTSTNPRAATWHFRVLLTNVAYNSPPLRYPLK